MMSEDLTGGATSSKREAAQVMAEVGGVRSSDDPVPDLWFGQPTEERRDATCSAEVKSSEGCGDGPQGLQAPKNVRQLQITLGRRASAFRPRNSESRMRENRLSGLMRGGKQTVIGPRASQSVASRLLYTPLDRSGWRSATTQRYRWGRIQISEPCPPSRSSMHVKNS